METSVGSFQAKPHLPALLERAPKGERITITKHGKPVAQLVPVEPADKPDEYHPMDGVPRLAVHRHRR